MRKILFQAAKLNKKNCYHVKMKHGKLLNKKSFFSCPGKQFCLATNYVLSVNSRFQAGNNIKFPI